VNEYHFSNGWVVEEAVFGGRLHFWEETGGG
jgi:hypothetical protein